MNLTTTRAAQTALDEPNIAPRRPSWAATIDVKRCWRAPDAREHAASTDAEHSTAQAIQSESEQFGLVLLGIGFESSDA